jgi:hypothetical protein
VTVDYRTADLSALAPGDYAPISGTLTFAPLQTTRLISVAVVGDLIDEPDESFEVSLSNPVNAAIATESAPVQISDDDGPPALSIQDSSVIEGDSGPVAMLFTVSLSAASALPINAAYATADGAATAPADYAAASGQIAFAPFQTSQTITVAVNGDTLFEGAETFTVTLSAPTNASLGDAAGSGTIVDDDNPPPSMSIADTTIIEGDSGMASAVFSVTLSLPGEQPITVAYATSPGSAVAPADYLPASGLLVFEAGQTTAVITVAVAGDTLSEPDETFLVSLSEPSNASLDRAQAQGTIRNDDGVRLFLPLVTVSVEADLVVKSLTPGPSGISVVIKNQGNLAVTQPFWVDLYIDPAVAPTAVNQTWELVGSTGGLAWGITGGGLPLDPGEELTLTIGDAFYQPAYSRWPGALPAGTTLYAQVDSASQGSSFGAIQEADEYPGRTYNNIFGPLVTALDVRADGVADRPVSAAGLPARP